MYYINLLRDKFMLFEVFIKDINCFVRMYIFVFVGLICLFMERLLSYLELFLLLSY